MTSKISVHIEPEPSILGDNVKCSIEFNDADMLGCKAEINITTCVKVHDKSPVNETKNLIHKKITIDQAKISFEIPASLLSHYSYLGFDIDIVSEVYVVVDDAIFFDSKLTTPITRQIIKKPEITDKAGSLSSPHDQRRFFKNLFALPTDKRRRVIFAMLIGYAMIAGIVFLAVHDLWVGRELAYLYTLYSVEPGGRIFLILFLTLFASIVSFIIMHIIVSRYLSGWLKVVPNKKRFPVSFAVDGSCRVADLVCGKTSTTVDKIIVRIVACNYECGQYTRTNGSTTETVNFTRPIREFILFEKTLSNIPKGIAIETYLNDTIYFKEIYKNLYPHNMLSTTHGISQHWEVQFLHDDFYDHEVNLSTNNFLAADFFK